VQFTIAPSASFLAGKITLHNVLLAVGEPQMSFSFGGQRMRFAAGGTLTRIAAKV
jgi:hypothetical protein